MKKSNTKNKNWVKMGTIKTMIKSNLRSLIKIQSFDG